MLRRKPNVVGRARASSGLFHAFRCNPGGLINDDPTHNDLGTIGTGQTSTAYAINDFRQIVGETKIDSQYPYNHAFIKTPDSTTGQGFIDLGALLTGYAASPDISYAERRVRGLGLQGLDGRRCRPRALTRRGVANSIGV